MALDGNSLGVVINLGVGLGILLAVLAIFDLVRYFIPSVYYYREQASRDTAYDHYDKTPLVALPRPRHTPLAWVAPALAYPEAAIVRTHGLDAAMYIRFLSTQVKIFAVLTFVTAFVLFPTYVTAPNRYLPEGNSRRPVGLEIASLANVPDKSSRLWVTFVSEIVVLAVVCWFLYRDICVYSAARRNFRTDSANPSNYAVIVLDIPVESRQESVIYDLFERCFPGDVAKVIQVRDAAKLVSMKKKYMTTVTKRERAEWDAAKAAKHIAAGTRPVVKVDGKPQDAIEWYASEQVRLREEIAVLQKAEVDTIAPLTHAAIVVFRTKRAATLAATSPIWRSAVEFTTSRIAEPRSVNWNRINITNWTSNIRRFTSMAALVALSVFWSVPSAAIQGLENFDEFVEINSNLSFLSDLKDNRPGLTSFLEGVLPPLILFVILLLVPFLVRFVVSFERIPSKPVCESVVRNYLFLFYMFSNFVYVVLIGSVTKNLSAIVDNPTAIVSILSTTVPAQATFLIKYVLLNSFIGGPLVLLCIGRLLLRPLIFLARTTRQKRNCDGIMAPFPYFKMYALAQMIAVISYIYCTIAPLICPCALLYFCIQYVCTRHVLLYSHRPLFEGSGALFQGANTGVLCGVFIHQLSMIGIFSLKLAATQAIICAVSLIFTLVFMVYRRRRFYRLAEHGSLVDQLDKDEEVGFTDCVPEHFVSWYEHPGLTPLEEVENLSGVSGQPSQP